MTSKSDITIEQLSKLGIEKLTELVLQQTANDKIFKRTVKTALASLKGSKSVVAAISKRLSALERARGFVDWDKARAFALDLEATVNAIVNELGKSDPHTAQNCSFALSRGIMPFMNALTIATARFNIFINAPLKSSKLL